MNSIPLEEAALLRTITRIGPDGRREVQDCLLREEGWTLVLDGREKAELFCLPFHLEDLAVGHLFSRGQAGVRVLRVDRDKRRVELRTDGSSRPLSSGPLSSGRDGSVATILDSCAVLPLQRLFNERCVLFRETGAAHSCALADSGGLIFFRDDVARHNALDKVVGAMLQSGVGPEGKVLLFSGRLASDMLEKASRIGVRLLIAPGAPSLAAVELAEAEGITLLGFVRRDNINIYSHPERIRGGALETGRDCQSRNLL